MDVQAFKLSKSATKWSLDTIPVEILRKIFHFVDSEDVLMLFHTGSALVRYKLQNYGANSNLNFGAASFKNILNVSRQWKLDNVRYLEIDDVPYDMALNLLKEPHIAPIIPQLHSIAIKTHRPNETRYGGAIHDLLANFEFYDLQHLELSLNASWYMQSSKLLARDTLRYLRLGCGVFEASLYSSLSSLTELSLPNVMALSPSTVHMLPLTLTSLTMGCDIQNHLQKYHVSWLSNALDLSPKQLREVLEANTFDRTKYHFIEDETDPDGEQSATLALYNLWLRRNDGWGCLRRLINLKHFGTCCPHDYAGAESARVPRTLTSADIRITFSTDVSTEFWPDSITRLIDRSHSSDLLAYISELESRPLYELHMCEGDFIRVAPLQYNKVRPKLVEDFVKKLPRTLRIWHSTIRDAPASAFTHLPPLTALYTSDCLTVDHIDALPATLKRLQCCMRIPHFNFKWPPNLTSLFIFTVVGEYISQELLLRLPITLVEFEIDRILLNDDFISLLASQQPSLLRIFSTSKMEEAARRFFNIRQSRCVRTFEPHFTPASLPILALHCEEFHTDVFHESVRNKDFEKFQKLTYIESKSSGSRPSNPFVKPKLDSGILDYLPPTVTRLKLNTLGTMDERIVTMLPPNVVCVELPSLAITLNSLPLLFSAVSNAENDGENHNAAEETTLSDEILLQLFEARRASMGEIIQLKLVHLDLELTLPHLITIPNHITKIDLSSDTNNQEFYVALPPKLTYLRLLESKAINNEVIQFLPASLRHLELTTDTKLFTPGLALLPFLTTLLLPRNKAVDTQSAAVLPRSLQTLDFGNSEIINDRFIADLPIGLTHLNLSRSLLTNGCFPQLPRGLTFLDISKCERIRPGNAFGLPTGLKQLLAPPQFLQDTDLSDFPNLHIDESQKNPPEDEIMALFS